MRYLTVTCAVLLSIPLLGSAANHVLQFAEPPLDDQSAGGQMWELIRSGGLMDWLAVGHAVIGILLFVPRTRFTAGLLQLPITIGIVAFNVTMFPPGVALAIGMLAVNLGVIADPGSLRRLLGSPGSPGS